MNQDSEGDVYLKRAFAMKRESNINEFDGFVEPHIPSDDGTLLGVDSNKNNIRDDVEIWINRNANTYNERMALRQYAEDMQYMLKAAESDQVELIAHAASVSDTSSYCVTHVFKGRKGLDVMKVIDAITINNRKRRNAMDNVFKHNFTFGPVIKNMSITEGYKACSFKLIESLNVN